MRIINRKPTRAAAVTLALAPFAATAVIYSIASHLRRLDNPADKILPSPQEMALSFLSMAFGADKRSGDYLLWLDTAHSLWRQDGIDLEVHPLSSFSIQQQL